MANPIVKKIIKALAKKAKNQKNRSSKANQMKYDVGVLRFISEPKVNKTIFSGTKNKPKKTILNVGPLSGRKTTGEFREAAEQAENIITKAAKARGKRTGGFISMNDYYKDII
tara:strand:- start:693 stop:1031 length:339 start_codon:yes stop_codon:yes gene_type:complete